MVPVVSDLEVVIESTISHATGMVVENMSEVRLLPSVTGNLEQILPHLALGVSSGTGGELSSQYNVRGGNYDENLVYVNDFQIYRRSEEHTSELQSRGHLVCRLLLERTNAR